MGVDDTAITGFFKNRSWSLSGQTALVEGLESLPGVVGRADVVALAAKVTSGDEGRFLVWALQILNRYREQVRPVEAIQALGRTPSARTPGGGLLIVAPVDYVSWTKKLDEFARRPDLRAVNERSVWITGRLSPRARHELGGLGWITKEDVLPTK